MKSPVTQDLFPILFFISTSNANIEARLARHEKLKNQISPNLSYIPSVKGKRVFGLPGRSIRNMFRLPNGNPVISQLARKILIFSVAFLLISPFLPFYQFTEGYQLDEFGVMDFTEQGTESALSTIMTEDGFLLKPALNSTEGDRTTANEIFAYSVEPGDTLSSIAQRFGIKRETLIMENDLWNVNNLKTGMMLKILPVDGISHLVKKGDTIDSVAKKYKAEKEIIIRQNQLEDGQPLLAGIALIIPGATKSVPSYAMSAPAAVAGYAGPTAAGKLIWPTLSAAKLTQGFHRGHYAIDIANRNKGPIFAAASGKIIKASYGWNGGYGNYIIIDHGNGMQTLYGHNEKLYVTEGQFVEQGQTISWMGRSGRVYGATGIHVHFEVRINGVKYNPLNFF